MEIKPIKLIPGVDRTEIPQTRVDRNLPRALPTIKAPAGSWQFKNGRISFNGMDVGRLIEQSKNQPPGFWSKLANDLDQFRKYFIRKNSRKRRKKVGDEVIIEELDPTGELGQLEALVDAYIAKIMRLLKRKYDETADGLSFSLDDDGQLSLNGMNVTSFIEMARNYPSEKARIFLKGLKNRLSVILSNKSSNPNYEKVRDITTALFRRIDIEIQRIVEKERLLEK